MFLFIVYSTISRNWQKVTSSSAHYLGYVDDDETPEMIMRKFEVLERYEKAMKERAQKESANGVSLHNYIFPINIHTIYTLYANC